MAVSNMSGGCFHFALKKKWKEKKKKRYPKIDVN